MSSDWAWRELAHLTDEIGPRLSGSAQLTLAVTQVADAMRSLGARVTLQPAKVPHWVRGDAQALVVEYPGRPAGITQRLALTALGGSAATPEKGLTARVLVVHDMAELTAHAGQVHGNIVLFESRFDQRLADNGDAGDAYRQAGLYRFNGPSAAAKLGAVAALVRSVGGADFRLPHTGVTLFKDGQTPIPAAALAAEDADLVTRLAAAGPVTLTLLLTPRTLPDADSDNVIADWPGREKPDEYVIVSGHLDSWDLATGATDDGVGVIGAAAVIEILKELDLHPRRSVRFIGWTNEENGGRGSKAYFASVAQALDTQSAAIESDEGAGRSIGIRAAVSKESLPSSGRYSRRSRRSAPRGSYAATARWVPTSILCSRRAYPASRPGSTHGIISIITTLRRTRSTRSIRKISRARSQPWPCSPTSWPNCPSRCPDSRLPTDQRLELMAGPPCSQAGAADITLFSLRPAAVFFSSGVATNRRSDNGDVLTS